MLCNENNITFKHIHRLGPVLKNLYIPSVDPDILAKKIKKSRNIIHQ